jgi:dihydroneopterin aldolase/2-amino-4-hydroxy-6-hydroxymethyldihydropteridine diphosphokinase/dihydropteroate synthase
MKRDPEPESQSGRQGRIFIALGSNIGDRMGNIRRAVKSLESEDGIRVIRTGRMYESEPMYVEDQARFANTVIEVSPLLTDTRFTRI